MDPMAMLSAFGGVVCSVAVGGVLIGWRRYNGYRDKTDEHTVQIAVLNTRVGHLGDKVDDVRSIVESIERKIDAMREP